MNRILKVKPKWDMIVVSLYYRLNWSFEGNAQKWDCDKSNVSKKCSQSIETGIILLKPATLCKLFAWVFSSLSVAFVLSLRCSLLLSSSSFLPLQVLSASCDIQSLAVVISNLAMLRLLPLAVFLNHFVLGIAPAASVCLFFPLSFRAVFYQTRCSEINSWFMSDVCTRVCSSASRR